MQLFECTSLLPSLAIHVAFFVKAYFHENQVAWLDGIESAFAYYDGVPLAIVSDNSRCLVNEHRNGFVKWNERYGSFCSYWKIKPIACRGYHPEGKGKIERAVRYVKGNALVGKDFRSWDELNRWLERWCLTVADEREISGLFEGLNPPKKRFWIEKSKLMKLEQPRTMRLREETRKVDKTGLIQADGRHYRHSHHYYRQAHIHQSRLRGRRAPLHHLHHLHQNPRRTK